MDYPRLANLKFGLLDLSLHAYTGVTQSKIITNLVIRESDWVRSGAEVDRREIPQCRGIHTSISIHHTEAIVVEIPCTLVCGYNTIRYDQIDNKRKGMELRKVERQTYETARQDTDDYIIS